MNEPVEIYVLDKRVRLLQPGKGFRTSLDSVMLAAACPVRAEERVLDMGCGVGGAAFCLLERVPESFVFGIEIQSEYIDLAKQNINMNNASGRIEFVCADIRDYEVPEKDDRFDHVICNPPYLEAGAHTPSPDEGRAIANGHDDETLTLKDWLDAGFHALKPGGSFTIIHRADALDRIVQGLGKRFGAVEVIPLWPRAGEEAKRVIVRARKDRKTPARMHVGLVLHEANGDYTEETEKVLRGGAAIV